MKKSMLLFVSSVAFVLAACATAPAAQPEPTAQPSQQIDATATTEPNVSAETVLTDGKGRPVVIPESVTTIISLAPSTTEIIYALDAGDRVLAVDMYSDFPAEVADLPKITNPDMSVNYEQITALNPDVIFAAAITPDDVITKLETLGLNVIVIGSLNSTFASVLTDIELVGTVLGQSTAASELTNSMQASWSELVAKVATVEKKPRVFWELDATDPAKPYTIGAGNFVNELLIAAGGENVFGQSDNPYPQVSLEQIVAEAPDVILLGNSIWGVTPDMVYARTGWEQIPAVKNKAVFPINDNLVSRPGPRIVEGLAEVVSVLHPNN